MEIFVPKYSLIKLTGNVLCRVWDKEDKFRMEPKHYAEQPNTVHTEVLAAIVDHIDGTDSGNTTHGFSITGNDSFAWSGGTAHGAYAQGESGAPSHHDQNGKNGILIDAEAESAYGGDSHAFFLDTMIVDTYSSNVRTMQASGEWEGTNRSGSGDSGSITKAYCGKDYNAPYASSEDLASPSNNIFTKQLAEVTNLASFTMVVGDVVDLTWTITVG